MSGASLLNTNSGDIIITGGNFISKVDALDAVGPNPIPLHAIAVDALPTSAQRYPPPRCHPGTRDAVLGVIDTWMKACSAEPICWLHGTAGGGKSAILQTICESSIGKNGPVFATFFFGRAQGRRALSEYLVPTIAHQFAQTNSTYRLRLRKTLEKNGDVFRKAIPAQMRTLLVGPLSDGGRGWLERFKGFLGLYSRPIVVVIDGLDECGGEENQVTIVKALAETVRSVKQPLRFLIASRPESHILKAFNQISRQTNRVRLDDTFRPDDAIRLYLLDQFRSIVEDIAETLSHTDLSPSWPGEDVITILVVAACGQFIYASLVIAFVRAPHTNPLQQLEIVLDAARNHIAFSPLDTLYLHILKNVTPRLQATLKKTLVCLVALAEPQTVDVIADILSVDETDVRLVLEQLRAVLRTDLEGSALFDYPIAFAHASFRDFLVDPRRSCAYTINVPQAHNIILAQLSSPEPEPPAVPSLFRSNQSTRPRTRYATDYDNISHHVQYLSLTSIPVSVALYGPLDLTTFHANLISLFDRIGHPGLEAVYQHIIQNVQRHEQKVFKLKKLLSCLAVLASPQTTEVIADLLGCRLLDLKEALEDLRAVLHNPDPNPQNLFNHPITFSHTSFRHFLAQSEAVNVEAAHNWILVRLSSSPGTPRPVYAQDASNISYHLPYFSLSSTRIPIGSGLLKMSTDLVSFFEDCNATQALDSIYEFFLRKVPQHLQPTLEVLLPALAILADPQTPAVVADLFSCELTDLAPIARSLRVALSLSFQETPALFPRDSFRDFLTDPQRCRTYTVDPIRAHSVILAQLSRPPVTSSLRTATLPLRMAYAPFFIHHLPHLSLSSPSDYGYADPTEFYSNLLVFFEYMGSSEGLDIVYLYCLKNVDPSLSVTLSPILVSLVILPDLSTIKDIATTTNIEAMDVWLVLEQLSPMISVKLEELQDELSDSPVSVIFPSFRLFLRDQQRTGVYCVRM